MLRIANTLRPRALTFPQVRKLDSFNLMGLFADGKAKLLDFVTHAVSPFHMQAHACSARACSARAARVQRAGPLLPGRAPAPRSRRRATPAPRPAPQKVANGTVAGYWQQLKAQAVAAFTGHSDDARAVGAGAAA